MTGRLQESSPPFPQASVPWPLPIGWTSVSPSTASPGISGISASPPSCAQTEEGLFELGLGDLAHVFGEAKTLMAPFVAQMSPDQPPDELLEKAGLAKRRDELDRKAWDIYGVENDKSSIYDAWVRYTRKHPERVFGH